MNNLYKKENLANPETIINHFDHLKFIKGESETKELNHFPIEIFPTEIQNIIKETNKTLNFPIDFIGSSLLFTTSVAIGNSIKIKIKEGWVENTVLYLCLVANKGVNKSHPITWGINPLGKLDELNFGIFLEKLKDYEANKKLSKDELEEKGIVEPIKPFFEQCLITDYTPEELISVLARNKRGLGVYFDEIKGWIGNFNRYNKGSEEQMWLSSWNGITIRVNRKSSDPILITCPFISVIGTIQPSVLKIFAENNRAENGFLDRLLFACVEDLAKPYWSEDELNPEITSIWEDIFFKIRNIPLHFDEIGNPNSEILEFSIDAKKRIFEWQRQITDYSNASKNDDIMGINAKIEMYAVRFSLILQMLFFACGEKKDAVSLKAVNGAIALVEYFTKSALRVRELIDNSNPLENLSADKKNLYDALPETFTTKQGMQLAFIHGIKERTFKRFLNEKQFFEKTKQGEYSKTQ
jgi:hypothetical protein